MTAAKRTQLKWAVFIGGVVWLLLVGWLMIATLPHGAVENHGTSEVKGRMSDCTGSFRERFECKQQVIIQSGRETFFTLAGRFLLVIVPPLVATGWLSSYLRRHPVELGHRPVEAGDWKARAQMHTGLQTPEQAAQALHIPAADLPHPEHKTHLHVADIAPAEDWKAKANQRIKKPTGV
jgi:hypothetical protein